MVLDHIVDGISVLDADLTIAYVNPTMERLYAHQAPLVGKKCHVAYHGRDEPCSPCPSIACLRDGTMHQELVPLVQAAGRTGWVELRAMPLSAGDGHVTGVLEFVRDVTTERRAEEALERENVVLKEMDATRQFFLSTASHELKSPIASMRMALEFIERQDHLVTSPRLADMLKIITNNVARLRTLVDVLLDFSRIDAGRLDLHREATDLTSRIRAAIKDLDYLASQRTMTLRYHGPPAIMAEVDPDRFDSIIGNLLSNAIKNSPPGTGIDIHVHDGGDTVAITVEDHGIGFTAEQSECLFTKFARIDRKGEARNFNIEERGTGLGLFITREIVTAHGGTITASSPGPGAGATFKVVLPKRVELVPASP